MTTFDDIKGQSYAKRALEVALAGDHPVLLVGPRNAGKRTLAASLPGLKAEAMDTCSCGNDRITRNCICSERLRYRYHRRFVRRAENFDIVIEVTTVPYKELRCKTPSGWLQADVCRRAEAAREFGKTHTSLQLDETGERTLEMAVRRISLTPGQYFAVLKVARTIANLDASERIKAKHVAEAILYRYDTKRWPGE